MQFVVTAFDYTDADALDRRLAHREQHLAGVRKLITEGRFLSGGAILDDAGKMIGSTLHVDFPTRADLDAQLRNDPYVSGRVWETIDVRQVKLVPLKLD
ncbi:MAG: YciI family protein [Gammaproteobacteria bacterium]